MCLFIYAHFIIILILTVIIYFVVLFWSKDMDQLGLIMSIILQVKLSVLIAMKKSEIMNDIKVDLLMDGPIVKWIYK